MEQEVLMLNETVERIFMMIRDPMTGFARCKLLIKKLNRAMADYSLEFRVSHPGAGPETLSLELTESSLQHEERQTYIDSTLVNAIASMEPADFSRYRDSACLKPIQDSVLVNTFWHVMSKPETKSLLENYSITKNRTSFIATNGFNIMSTPVATCSIDEQICPVFWLPDGAYREAEIARQQEARLHRRKTKKNSDKLHEERLKGKKKRPVSFWLKRLKAVATFNSSSRLYTALLTRAKKGILTIPEFKYVIDAIGRFSSDPKLSRANEDGQLNLDLSVINSVEVKRLVPTRTKHQNALEYSCMMLSMNVLGCLFIHWIGNVLYYEVVEYDPVEVDIMQRGRDHPLRIDNDD